jgi:hypothetical protein
MVEEQSEGTATVSVELCRIDGGDLLESTIGCDGKGVDVDAVSSK